MERIDLALISYVFYHYMSNDHCYDWLAARLVDASLSAVLIISRFESLRPQIGALEARGVHVTKLMTQPQFSRHPHDDRQLLFTKADPAAVRRRSAEGGEGGEGEGEGEGGEEAAAAGEEEEPEEGVIEEV